MGLTLSGFRETEAVAWVPAVLTVFLSLWPHSPSDPILPGHQDPKGKHFCRPGSARGRRESVISERRLEDWRRGKFCTSRLVPLSPTKRPVFQQINNRRTLTTLLHRLTQKTSASVAPRSATSRTGPAALSPVW